MTKQNTLDSIFRPKSVAVIGATPRKGTIGQQLVHNIIRYGFNGTLFPVNPKYKFIHSIKCYPSVSSIPDPIDLAIIIVPKEHVLQVAQECGERRVKGLVIISAGFREIGGEGLKREAALAKLQEKYGYRIVGPNCMGVIGADPDVCLNATFAPLEPQSGSLAFMTQSGALGVAILLLVSRLHLGLSYFASVGNKLDVGGNDLLEYWEDDDTTRVIALYLESFGEPRRFTELAKRITKRKPIILVKSGTTPAGSRAASSHTGHLAGLDIAVDALLHQCGVIRVPTIAAMMDLALAFTKNPIPKGDRIGIVTNAGGPGIMATDAIVNRGMTVATLADSTLEKLRAILPEESSVRNPLDMIAGAGPVEYGKALRLVLDDDNVDIALVIFVPPIMIEPREVVEQIVAAARDHDKPVFMVLMAEERFYQELPVMIPDAPPLYRFPESAVRAIAAVNRYRLWRERPEGKIRTFPADSSVGRSITERKSGYLPPTEVNKLLETYGLPVCRMKLVAKDGDVLQAADEVGYPLVLKVHGERIIHKSDFGGVLINISAPDELAAARLTMLAKLKETGMEKEVEGFLVQEMAPTHGKEVILGMTTDPKFGPILMCGMGGKYVEITADITFRVMPVSDIDAWDMVKEIKSYPLLEGVRGEPRVDIEFIVESIQRLAQMVNDLPDIVELDLNPVIVTPERTECRVVDARIRVETEVKDPSPASVSS